MRTKYSIKIRGTHTLHFKSGTYFCELDLPWYFYEYMMSGRIKKRNAGKRRDATLPERDKVVFIGKSHDSFTVFFGYRKKIFQDILDSFT